MPQWPQNAGSMCAWLRILRTVPLCPIFDCFDCLRSGQIAANVKQDRTRQVANFSPALPSEAESTLARETSRILASRIPASGPLQFRLIGSSEETVGLPAAAVRVLVRVLEEMAQGNAINIVPVHAELTTQEAADMLNISRPSLIQLLDEGRIEFRKVGTHRRVRFESLLAYKRKADSDRRAALAELAAYDRELGL